ncbi:MAG: alpha/beta hydrolase, partial [Akkermansiaceae bacterium]|nr:alpha/beta hydrolase [Akkermansiaceae bacterium]
MKIEDYPPQDPLSEIGKLYHARVLELARNTAAEECSYGNDPYQAVAVFAAPEPNGNVLVFGHGGGWTTGYKEWMEFMAPALNAAGITFVSIGYRLAPEHVFPAGFEDWVSAVTWVHGNIAERGGNPDRIFLGGHSAGGHYASLLGVRRDWQEAAGLPRDVLRGCLPVSG